MGDGREPPDQCCGEERSEPAMEFVSAESGDYLFEASSDRSSRPWEIPAQPRNPPRHCISLPPAPLQIRDPTDRIRSDCLVLCARRVSVRPSLRGGRSGHRTGRRAEDRFPASSRPAPHEPPRRGSIAVRGRPSGRRGAAVDPLAPKVRCDPGTNRVRPGRVRSSDKTESHPTTAVREKRPVKSTRFHMLGGGRGGGPSACSPPLRLSSVRRGSSRSASARPRARTVS